MQINKKQTNKKNRDGVNFGATPNLITMSDVEVDVLQALDHLLLQQGVSGGELIYFLPPTSLFTHY
jgi:hypothetical protein